MFYRVQQFIKAITASVSEDEKRWIKGYLTEKEQALFFKLKVYEQKHALCVAKLLSEWTNESQEMIRLGLLHDIGKVLYPLNPIQKSIIVILHKVTLGKIKRFNQFKIVKCYYEHPILEGIMNSLIRIKSALTYPFFKKLIIYVSMLLQIICKVGIILNGNANDLHKDKEGKSYIDY